MGAWTVGHNLTGYLPESDVFAYGDWADAAEGFKAEARDYADRNDDAAGEGLTEAEWEAEPPSMRATVDSILSDPSFPLVDGQDYAMIVADNDDRRITFFLAWSLDREPEDDDVITNDSAG